MRTLIACVIVFILPALVVIGIKNLQSLPAEPTAPAPKWAGRTEVLFFNASWCGPCRQMKPVVGQLRRQGYRLRDVDVDQNRKLAGEYSIRAVPTFVFLENGREVKRFSGGTSPDSLRKLCSAYR